MSISITCSARSRATSRRAIREGVQAREASRGVIGPQVGYGSEADTSTVMHAHASSRSYSMP
jgi:hypothetical protein